MYIETSSPRQSGDVARLSSPSFTFSGNTCLTFSYHMYGATIGSLNVTVNARSVFSASGNKGNLWFKVSIRLRLYGRYPVRNINIYIHISNLYILFSVYVIQGPR